MPEDLSALLAEAQALVSSQLPWHEAEYQKAKAAHFARQAKSIPVLDLSARALNASTDRLLAAVRRELEKQMKERTDKNISKEAP